MFALNVTLSLSRLESMKAHLRAAIPDVKSSHRVEALARGLGFRTYAAALAAAPSDIVCAVDGEAFRQYLKAKGFEVSPAALFRAGAKIAIESVLEEIPRLTAHGFGIGPVRRDEDHTTIFRKSQESLFSDLGLDAFLRSLALLARITRIKSICLSAGSYRLKHIAENYKCRFPTGEELGPEYVPNGAFIAAAIHAGFRWRNTYPSVNASFNMSASSVDDLDCEARPDGAIAQERRRRAERRKHAKQYGVPQNRLYF